MARTIDFSKPLTADDQKYVEDRPWLIEDARLRGEDVVFEDDSEFTVVSEDGEDTGETGEDTDDEDSTEGDEDESEDGEETEDEVAPYSEWDYQALKDEAKNRDLKVSGSKEQLIERLEEDDASNQA